MLVAGLQGYSSYVWQLWQDSCLFWFLRSILHESPGLVKQIERYFLIEYLLLLERNCTGLAASKPWHAFHQHTNLLDEWLERIILALSSLSYGLQKSFNVDSKMAVDTPMVSKYQAWYISKLWSHGHQRRILHFPASDKLDSSPIKIFYIWISRFESYN